MYTLHNLQEKLDKAKSTLREVESTILKVEGKPANLTFNARFSKGDARFGREENDGDRVNNEPFNLRRRRVVDESTSRRHADGDGAWRPFDKNTYLRRRSAPSPEDDPPPRKKLFPSVGVDDSNAREASHDKRRSIFSALGKMEKNEHFQPRGKHIRQHDPELGRSQPRSIFSRLSGLHNESELPMDDEDDQILQRRFGDNTPSIASRVQAIQRPTLSREEVLASEKKDEKSKQRDRRMFGALVGTLQQFRREETQVKEREERRQQIEKKVEDEAVRDRERMAEEKRNLLSERKRREADIKRIEWSLNRVKEFADWEAGLLLLKNFIRTNSKPHVFFMPKVHNDKTKELLHESSNNIDDMIEQRRATLEEEISSSEQKARRAAGELDDVDKENDAVGGNIGGQDPIKEETENEGADAEWTEASYEKAADDIQVYVETEEAQPADPKLSREKLVDATASEKADQVPANIASNGNDSNQEHTTAPMEVVESIVENPSRSPTSSPKNVSPKKEALASSTVKPRSRKDSSSRSRSPPSKKVTKAKRANLSPKRKPKSKSKSRSRSKSRDSNKKQGIQERLERLAGQGGRVGQRGTKATAGSRDSSSRSRSRSSSSSSRTSSSSSDSH